MSDAKSLRDELWGALGALPLPVAQTDALACAEGILPRKEYMDFAKWFSQNGATVLARLNAVTVE